MTVSAPDIRRHRQQFPSLRRYAYFNYGGQGPLPESALSAIAAAHLAMQEQGPFSHGVNGWIRHEGQLTRCAMAAALGAPIDSLTLTENVTVGCNIPLWGLPWRSGDHIAYSDCEHPGIIAAIQEVGRRFGVSYSVFPLQDAPDPLAAVDAALRPSTRLLVISHLLWNTGALLPLQEIGALCHGRSTPVRVLVDAAQTVGSLPLNLPQLDLDFYAFTGHKWWCGPAGLGGLYVHPEAQGAIQPTFIGWRGITTDAQAQPTGWKASGERFEVATSDYSLYGGLRQCLQVHAAWGSAEARYQRLVQLSQQLWRRLGQQPRLRCLLAEPPQAGLVSFYVLDRSGEPSVRLHQQLVADLEAQGYLLRTLANPSCVRACTHYLTLEDEVDQLGDAIATWLADHPA